MAELHAEGRFRARAVEGDYGNTATGTEQVAVLFELETGSRLTWYGYLTEKAQERALESLLHCGVTNLETLEGLSDNEVELVIQHEEYDNVMRARIAFVNAIGSGGVAMKTKMTEGARKSVASRLKGNFVKMQRERGIAPTPVTGRGSRKSALAEEIGADDDIPF